MGNEIITCDCGSKFAKNEGMLSLDPHNPNYVCFDCGWEERRKAQVKDWDHEPIKDEKEEL